MGQRRFRVGNQAVPFPERVQIIMEELGGGGHQTVAGVQIQNADADEIKRQIIELTKKQFDEAEEKEKEKEKEKNESNLIE